MRHHCLGALHGGWQKCGGLASQRGAQTDGLGGVEPVADAARGDEGNVRAGGAHLREADRRGNAPVAEDLAKVLAIRRRKPGTFHGSPAGATCSGHVDGGNTAGHQAAGHLARDAAAHFLGDDRHGQCAGQLFNGGLDTRPVAVAARLHRLLHRVEMEDQGIGPELVHGAAGLLQPHAIDQLHGAEIAIDGNGGSNAAQLRAQARCVRGGERDALRAHTHGKAQLLRRLGEGAVDAVGNIRTAGHR